jgi:hypothetical protein
MYFNLAYLKNLITSLYKRHNKLSPPILVFATKSFLSTISETNMSHSWEESFRIPPTNLYRKPITCLVNYSCWIYQNLNGVFLIWRDFGFLN